MEKELNEKEVISEKEYNSGINRIAESFKRTTEVDLIFTNNLSLLELLELVEEESGEFFQAFHKYKRAIGLTGPQTSVKSEDAVTNVKEELCDLIFNIIQCMQKMQMFDDFDYWRETKSKKGKDEICRDLRSTASK